MNPWPFSTLFPRGEVIGRSVASSDKEKCQTHPPVATLIIADGFIDHHFPFHVRGAAFNS
jgi:hypothetical protein